MPDLVRNPEYWFSHIAAYVEIFVCVCVCVGGGGGWGGRICGS